MLIKVFYPLTQLSLWPTKKAHLSSLVHLARMVSGKKVKNGQNPWEIPGINFASLTKYLQESSTWLFTRSPSSERKRAWVSLKWRHNTQHNDTHHNNNMTLTIMALVIPYPLCWVLQIGSYADCHASECRCAECLSALTSLLTNAFIDKLLLTQETWAEISTLQVAAWYPFIYCV